MSPLKTIVAISIAVLGATAGSAQAAGSHKHISHIDFFQDAEEYVQFLMSGVRIPNDIFGDPSKVPERPDGTWETSTDSRDKTMTTTTESQPDTTWTTQEVSQPPQSPWTPHYATP